MKTTPSSRTASAFLAVCLFLAASWTLNAQIPPHKRRGKLLNTEVVKVQDQTSFDVVLEQRQNAPFPYFKVYKIINRTVHLINVYETVLFLPRETALNQPFEMDQNEPTVVPNEFIRANPSLRHETVFNGPFANETFNFNGVKLTTDQHGCAADSTHLLFTLLDDLNHNATDIAVSHPEYGTKTFSFTRLVLRPPMQETPAYRVRDPRATMDVLEAMGLDFSTTAKAGKTPLSITCNAPANVVPGELISLTVSVTNTGDKLAGNVILCSFSRETWLDGKLFYIGNLQPGQTRSFSRLAVVGDNLPTTITAAIASWDTFQANPKNACFVTMQRQRRP